MLHPLLLLPEADGDDDDDDGDGDDSVVIAARSVINIVDKGSPTEWKDIVNFFLSIP